MNHLKLFEEYNKSALEFVNKYYHDETGQSYYGSYEDILDRVNNFYNTDFPYGIKNIPNNVLLYRLLNVEKIEDINKDELGKYYVGDKKMFNDEDFLESFLFRYGEEMKKWFIITIETTKDNIDILNSVANRAEYPDEYQITIKDDKKLKIVNIEEIEPISSN